MEQTYRRVEMLELHDANIIVTPQSHNEGGAGWLDFPGVKECFRLSYKDLDRLATHFNLPNTPYIHTAVIKGQEKRVYEYLEDFEPTIYREIPHIGTGDNFEPGNGSQRIDWIEVATPTQPGYLLIRVCFTWKSTDGNIFNWVRELTYSGNYTIWWVMEENGSDD